jgi:signal transducing adaptor molecule
LKKWAEGDFKNDPQLNLIPSLYNKLKQEGHDFSEPHATIKRPTPVSNDPNVVSSQQEQDDIAKAIELSLKENKSAKTTSSSAFNSTANNNASATTTTSLYPSASALNSVKSSSVTAPEPRKVRALYDFEAAEDNELTFKTGEIIMVIEESDPNWWRGSNQRGEGYFPANFVTADLSAESTEKTKEEVQSNYNNASGINESGNNSGVASNSKEIVEINEEAIDRLLFLLHEADPTDPSQDSNEIVRLENAVNQMGPLIDAELEHIDRKHAQLTKLSSDLIDTINLYHNLMRESEKIQVGNYQTAPMYQNQYPHQPAYGTLSNNGNMMPINYSIPPDHSSIVHNPQNAFNAYHNMQPVPQQMEMPSHMNYHQPQIHPHQQQIHPQSYVMNSNHPLPVHSQHQLNETMANLSIHSTIPQHDVNQQ